MFDIGWSEIALIAGATIVVVGPEDMPRVLYNLGKVVRKIKTLTHDMQKSIDSIIQEVEVDDIARDLNGKIGGADLQFEIDRQIAREEEAEEADIDNPPHQQAKDG